MSARLPHDHDLVGFLVQEGGLSDMPYLVAWPALIVIAAVLIAVSLRNPYRRFPGVDGRTTGFSPHLPHRRRSR